MIFAAFMLPEWFLYIIHVRIPLPKPSHLGTTGVQGFSTGDRSGLGAVGGLSYLSVGAPGGQEKER